MAEVKAHKGIPQDEDLLDRSGRLELAAHDFRLTLTEERLTQEGVATEGEAIDTHREVGKEVRAVMQRKDGKSPEDLPVEPSIKKLVSKHRKKITGGNKGS